MAAYRGRSCCRCRCSPSGATNSASPTRLVHVVCQAGGRSAQAAQLLIAAGIDARSVTGGTAAWIGSGRPTQTGTPHF